MYLIVGLGNPSSKYAKTYHNLGFLCIEYLSQEFDAPLKKIECKSVTAHTKIFGSKVILAQPQTYMNLSGDAVLQLVNKYKIEPDKVLIIFDDVDLEKGQIRFRASGSGGTHNGMRHIVQCLGEDIPRLRIGMGRPPQGFELADYVLSRIAKEDEPVLFEAIKNASARVKEFLKSE